MGEGLRDSGVRLTPWDGGEWNLPGDHMPLFPAHPFRLAEEGGGWSALWSCMLDARLPRRKVPGGRRPSAGRLFPQPAKVRSGGFPALSVGLNPGLGAPLLSGAAQAGLKSETPASEDRNSWLVARPWGQLSPKASSGGSRSPGLHLRLTGLWWGGRAREDAGNSEPHLLTGNDYCGNESNQ